MTATLRLPHAPAADRPALLDLATTDAGRAELQARGFRLHRDPRGCTLIAPRKTKFDWAPEELALRSVIVDDAGVVLSAGFPKFFNAGEDVAHDAAFAAACTGGDVEFAEKQDGSLILADLGTQGLMLRTRGMHTCAADFEIVPAVVGRLYPALAATYAAAARGDLDPALTAWLSAHTLCLEYCAPDNRILVEYDSPTLVLLGYVHKATVLPGWDGDALRGLSAWLGVPVAPTVELPTDPEAAAAQVAGWVGREGVVARFIAPDGLPLLLKLKSAWYFKFHALKYGMTPARIRALAWLLGITNSGEAAEQLGAVGLDFETITMMQPELDAYCAERAGVLARLETLASHVATWDRMATGDRRAMVALIRAGLAADPKFATGPTAGSDAGAGVWFHVALALWQGKRDHAERLVLADLLGEKPPTLGQWAKDRDAMLAELLMPPAPPDA